MATASSARFYKDVAVVAQAAGFGVQLDSRPVRTPAGGVLVLPTAALAEAIAVEWRSQGEKLQPASLRLTRLANTAIDRIAPDPAPLVGQIAGYGETDLLCYRAEAPHALVARQDAGWQPWLDWAAQVWGARLRVTAAIEPLAQDARHLAALRDVVAGYDAFTLAGLGEAVGILGSLILGLAVAEARLDGAAAFALARLDEQFQTERWGEDWEASVRTERLRDDLLLAERLIRLAARHETGGPPA